MKQIIARRVPPGDRWNLTGDSEGDVIVYDSLTDCLNQIHIVHQATQFYLDAVAGTVSIDDGVPVVAPIKKYRLYGEEM